MRIAVFLFDLTGIMAKSWADAGYQCFIIDGQHPGGVRYFDDNILSVGVWLEPCEINNNIGFLSGIIGNQCDFIFGFPECTDLAVSGAAHFKKKAEKNPLFQHEAIAQARLVELLGQKYGCKYAFENPVSVISTKLRKPDFSFHPYEYGGYLPDDDVHPHYPDYIKPRDAYPKKTCIWSGGGFVEPQRKPVECDPGYSDQHKKLGGKSLKTKNIRSATPRGFARAVFECNN